MPLEELQKIFLIVGLITLTSGVILYLYFWTEFEEILQRSTFFVSIAGSILLIVFFITGLAGLKNFAGGSLMIALTLMLGLFMSPNTFLLWKIFLKIKYKISRMI